MLVGECTHFHPTCLCNQYSIVISKTLLAGEHECENSAGLCNTNQCRIWSCSIQTTKYVGRLALLAKTAQPHPISHHGWLAGNEVGEQGS